ncbi:MAG: TolC family protein [Zoogloeaceae bacterium]|nr:TolC family protein [Zoogloeaceae bacterium]
MVATLRRRNPDRLAGRGCRVQSRSSGRRRAHRGEPRTTGFGERRALAATFRGSQLRAFGLERKFADGGAGRADPCDGQLVAGASGRLGTGSVGAFAFSQRIRRGAAVRQRLRHGGGEGVDCGDVARTYLLLRGVEARQALFEENRRIAEDLARLTESRQQNGVATRHDAAAARADLAGIEARLTQLQQQRDALLNALALLLGAPPRALEARIEHARLPPMPERLPVGVPSELARQRPDILQAEARLRAAVADIGAAKADFYPRVSLTGSIGVQAFDFSDLGSWDSRRFSLGPTLYLPIFQGGRLERNLALSEARHRLAGIAYQQTVLRAWHEVDDALNAYAAELRRHAQLREALTQNQIALEVARRAYQEGAADFTAVLIARRSLLASQAELTDCATASALSVVALYRALGGGWSPELRVNTTLAGDDS